MSAPTCDGCGRHVELYTGVRGHDSCVFCSTSSPDGNRQHDVA